MTKNQLIIKAFQDLDAEMLDLLLDENQPYQEVSKDIFVTEVRKLFSNFREDENLNCDLKKIPGECDGCNKGQKGFAFVNKDNLALMELLFEEEDGKIIDICPCSSFKAEGKEYDRIYRKFSFYEEDKVNFKPNFKYYQDAALAQKGVEEIESEIKSQGILSAKFCQTWFDKYRQFEDVSEIFTGKAYKFKREINLYLDKLESFYEMIKREESAKNLLKEFFSFPLISESSIKDWLIRADFEFNYYKYGLDMDVDFRSETYHYKGIVLDFKPIFYAHNIGVVLSKYFDWIPLENQLKVENRNADIEFEEEDFPF